MVAAGFRALGAVARCVGEMSGLVFVRKGERAAPNSCKLRSLSNCISWREGLTGGASTV